MRTLVILNIYSICPAIRHFVCRQVMKILTICVRNISFKSEITKCGRSKDLRLCMTDKCSKINVEI